MTPAEDGGSPAGRRRVRVRCRGAVQGVGFRPTVHRLATELRLGGRVANDPDGATVEVEGTGERVERFVDLLPRRLPPLARLDAFEVEAVEPLGEREFTVIPSRLGRRASALIPPDAALCADCRCDMEDPANRRYRYAFTTCTNCGPRLSLVRQLPYDRVRTAMACFPLCADCGTEYRDPADRRFHAEPVCCPACGPRLWLARPSGDEVATGPEALAAAREALRAGRIVALKGLGGFQLACRADDEDVVAALRERKRRPTKPLAVMVPDLGAARALVRLGGEETALLSSPRSPVVLAPRLDRCRVALGVAPGLDDLGVLLPTTPLHVELFRGGTLPPLVMTSGNLSEEPICRGNREALDRLGTVADLFLLHDRDVVRRVDDSVVRATPVGPVVVRRARGYVPEPLPLPEPTPEPVLALGGFLQVTACLADGAQAVPSQHVGDLDSEAARVFLEEVVAGLEELLETRARVVACDLHPDYPSRWLAERLASERGGRTLPVQHHLAHAAAVLGEHGRFPEAEKSVLALSLDGTGYGPDGTSWGGEWLEVRGDLRWHRLGHLAPLPLVGGETAVREPWRVAAAALAREGAADLLPRLPLADQVRADRLLDVARLAARRWPDATGAGRLFEAAGAMLGLCATNTWEGEAAARLEALASSTGEVASWPECRLDPGAATLPSGRLLTAAARRVVAGESLTEVAAGFHATFCRLAVELTVGFAGSGRDAVAVGGGCMVNRRLLAGLSSGLAAAGFEPLLPRRLPPGDGGLSYGQAVVAAVALARGVEPRQAGEHRPAALAHGAGGGAES